MKPRFISVRNDGLGARLRPILNAVALARECDGSFEFSWPDNAGTGSGEALAPAAEIFSQDFIARHHRDGWLDLFDCTRGQGPKRKQFRSHILHKVQIGKILKTGHSNSVCHITSFDDLREVLARPNAENVYREAFQALEFSDHIKTAIRAAQKADLSQNTTAIHLRAGDIVEKVHRFSGNYTQWVIPFPLARRLVEREMDKGRDVVIFGQDPVVVQHICDATGAREISAFARDHAFDATQMWFFETCLMARCQQIIAGGASSFSRFPSWIGNVEITNGYHLFDDETALELILTDATDAAPVSDLQKAFSFWAITDTYGQDIAPGDHVACLKKAVQYDPASSLYKLALINALIDTKGFDEASALLSSLIVQETQQHKWSPGCLRQVLFGLSFPNSKFRALLLSNFEYLWAQGDFGAGLCIALTARAPGKIDRISKAIAASDWTPKDFFAHALKRRLEDVQAVQAAREAQA